MRRNQARAVKNALAGFVLTGDHRTRKKHLRTIKQFAQFIDLDDLILASIDELFELLFKTQHLDENLVSLCKQQPKLFTDTSLAVVGKPQQISQPLVDSITSFGEDNTDSTVEGCAPDSEVVSRSSAKKSDGKKPLSKAKGGSPPPKANTKGRSK